VKNLILKTTTKAIQHTYVDSRC